MFRMCPKCKSSTTCCQSAVDRLKIGDDLVRIIDRQRKLIEDLKEDLEHARGLERLAERMR